jgi:hypothetical protein
LILFCSREYTTIIMGMYCYQIDAGDDKVFSYFTNTPMLVQEAEYMRNNYKQLTEFARNIITNKLPDNMRSKVLYYMYGMKV